MIHFLMNHFDVGNGNGGIVCRFHVSYVWEMLAYIEFLFHGSTYVPTKRSSKDAAKTTRLGTTNGLRKIDGRDRRRKHGNVTGSL